jgi:hypothetical protein
MQKSPVTYTGTNTNELYVLALKKGKEVKLKVREINCHSGIVVDPIAIDDVTYKTSDELLAAPSSDLQNNTIYVVRDNNVTYRYFFYEGYLTLLNDGGKITLGISYGRKYESYYSLYNDIANLEENTIYSVDDKGTVEQYIFKDNELTQISSGINNITVDPGDNKSNIADVGEIINYNMPELVNGNYRYKNHSQLNTVISDMPNLESAIEMFKGTSLKVFYGNLSSLKEARGMFGLGCELNEESIINIIDSIPNLYDSPEKPYIITISHDSNITAEQRTEFEVEASSKGWEIEWIIN